MDVTEEVSTNKVNKKPIKLEWADISNERYRTYEFAGGGEVTINNPVKLNVKRKPEGDSHRVLDNLGVAHYIPAGWIHLYWEATNGQDPFSF